MKNKIKYLVLLFTIMFMMTGCVKFNATMEIKKDKSMDFNIIYAMDEQYLEGEELFEEEDLKKLIENGFTVENYTENNMKGVTIKKHFKNIDDVSSTEDISYSLSDIDSESKDVKIFKVVKGFFSNKYVANFTFDAGMGGDEVSYNNDENLLVLDDEESDEFYFDVDEAEGYDLEGIEFTEDGAIYGNDADFDLSGLGDLSSLSNMEMKFNVKLPYKATKTNASTNIDNKELSWDLTSISDGINFEFTMLNITNIVIVAVIGLAVVATVIIVVLSKKNKKTNTLLNNI